MKILKRIRIVPILIAMALLLPLSVSAALPPSAEIQWENIKRVSCEVYIIGNLGTVSATIVGNTGTTVVATASLYEFIDGNATMLYTESTPTPNPVPFASFAYEFEPQSGATYYLVVHGVVSMNGVHESIDELDIETMP